VIHALSTWIYEQDKAWYQKGIHKLVCPWRKTVRVEASFMEKIKYTVKPSRFIMSHFHDLQINMYCEKNETQFLGIACKTCGSTYLMVQHSQLSDYLG